ncbi:unnamed protein product [Hyaloperonospora brassicae]|uniref:cGMP-dependent protein kinase N-terminal coiled-coil domain-containing protein n=1 Tax=Hyaloperonospora brassicae TaxID=162125 RepID=A0AAV0UEH5_HYABA|nr:unnamed protein product [Hyaloperonospora brassicae]
MNRLLQHFVDSNGAPRATAPSRLPVPVPPQSSGGSYHGSNRGSYQRAAPGSPFFYQPAHVGASGLAEIPLTSSSSGAKYETVDLNADTSRSQAQRQSYTEGITGVGTEDIGTTRAHMFRDKSVEAGPEAERLPSGVLHSTGTGQLTPVEATVKGMQERGTEQSGTTDTSVPSTRRWSNGHMAVVPYPSVQDANRRRTASATSSAMSTMEDVGTAQKGEGVFARQMVQNDSPTTFCRDEHGSGYNTTRAFAAEVCSQVSDSVQPLEKETGYQRRDRDQVDGQLTMVEPEAAASFHVGKSPFESPDVTNENRQCQDLPSADSLFGSPAPMNSGVWPPAASFAQPASKPAQSQDFFATRAPTASSLFDGGASMSSRDSQITPSRAVSRAPPVPRHPPSNLASSSIQSGTGASSSVAMSQAAVALAPSKSSYVGTPPLLASDVRVSASSVVRSENHFTRAAGSRKLSASGESLMKFGLDVRQMKYQAGKREDDAVSNAPSIALSRMSMLSTLDDSLKLSDMYKQMTTRLQREKQDLLKVVSNQAEEIAYLKKHIKSLELQMKKQHLARDA